MDKKLRSRRTLPAYAGNGAGGVDDNILYWDPGRWRYRECAHGTAGAFDERILHHGFDVREVSARRASPKKIRCRDTTFIAPRRLSRELKREAAISQS